MANVFFALLAVLGYESDYCAYLPCLAGFEGGIATPKALYVDYVGRDDCAWLWLVYLDFEFGCGDDVAFAFVDEHSYVEVSVVRYAESVCVVFLSCTCISMMVVAGCNFTATVEQVYAVDVKFLCSTLVGEGDYDLLVGFQACE